MELELHFLENRPRKLGPEDLKTWINHEIIPKNISWFWELDPKMEAQFLGPGIGFEFRSRELRPEELKSWIIHEIVPA